MPFIVKASAKGADVMLSWTRAKDPNSDPVTYLVVYKDTLAENLTDTTFTIPNVGYNTTVAGTVIAKDNHGLSTAVAFMFTVGSQPFTSETIRFVKPDDGRTLKNGLSWATAYDQTQLQTAINSLTVTGGQVWVAQGIYKPTTDATNRLAYFTMRSKIGIYGGFSADPNSLLTRNPSRFPTILSGDIDGDGTLANNSYSVIVNNPESVTGGGTLLDSTAVLDGFIITGGNATGPIYGSGGGIRNLTNYPTNTGPTIANCQIIGNAAGSGGGVSNSYSYNLRFINCLIANNSAVYGGGMYNYSSNPRLINCVIRDNSAMQNSDIGGGGIFSGGGGIYNSNASSPKLINCTLTGNSAPPGGGGALYDSYYSSPYLFNCILWNNGGQNAIVTGKTSPGTAFDAFADHSLIEAEETTYAGDSNVKATLSPFVSIISLELLLGSGAIDGGSNEAYRRWGGQLVDFTGNPRIVNQIIDIGAIESK